MTEFLEATKQLQQRVKAIVLHEWDPVGVANVPEAQDEYDAYIAEVTRMLAMRAPVSKIEDYLWWLETTHMGLCGDRQRTNAIAAKLASLVT